MPSQEPAAPPSSYTCEDELDKLISAKNSKKQLGYIIIPIVGFFIGIMAAVFLTKAKSQAEEWELTEKEENMKTIKRVLIFLVTMGGICAFIPLNDFNMGKDFQKEVEKTKTLPVDPVECATCVLVKNYNPEVVSSVTLSDGNIKYLPQNTWIKNLKVLNNTKPVLMMEYTDSTGKTTEKNVSDIFDFAEIASGYQCVLPHIYVPEDVKMYINTSSNVVFETDDMTQNENVRTFIKAKRIVARNCINGVIVIDPAYNLEKNWITCCE